MKQHDIVRLDHCQLYYAWAGPVWNLAQDLTGWLALDASGNIRFFSGQDSSESPTWLTTLAESTYVAPAPKYFGISFGIDKALRAKLGSRERIVNFTGLKTGLSKQDLTIGHTPVLGELFTMGKLLTNELPGSGKRALQAASVWRDLLSGRVQADQLAAIGASGE